MFSVDDLMDLCSDAVTRGPDDPVPQPLFEAIRTGDRSVRQWSSRKHKINIGVAQRFRITDVGDFEIIVREVD